MSFLKDGLSIDETRVSAMVILALGVFGVIAYREIRFGDIDINLFFDTLKTLILAIAGVNGVNLVAKKFTGQERRPP
jgi:hypothetical protein